MLLTESEAPQSQLRLGNGPPLDPRYPRELRSGPDSHTLKGQLGTPPESLLVNPFRGPPNEPSSYYTGFLLACT